MSVKVRLTMGNKKYKDDHFMWGLCRDCSKPVAKDRTRCKYHLYRNSLAMVHYQKTHRDKVHAFNAKRIQKFRDEGRCTCCGAPLDDPTKAQCCNCRLGVMRVKPIMWRGDAAHMQNSTS